MSIDRYELPSDNNTFANEFEKLSKYKDLEIEIVKMWKMKAKTIPVIVRALGMIKKGTQKYVNEIPGNLSLAAIQKIVLHSTVHILFFFFFYLGFLSRPFTNHKTAE